MDFTDNTPIPEQTKTVDLLEEDGDLTRKLGLSNSYGSFIEPSAKPKFFNVDLSQNKLYKKRMESRKLEKNYLYSVQLMDNYVEYTTESPHHIQNWLCQKYQFFLDTSQLKELKEKGLIVIQLTDSYEKFTITKISK